MKIIDIINADFFSNLYDFDYDGNHYDLHNFYSCHKIAYSESDDKELSLFFKSDVTYLGIKILFTEVDIVKFNLTLNEVCDNMTIDSLYRGRFQEDKSLLELSKDGKAYIYADFLEGYSLEFFSKSMQITFANE